MKKQYMIADVHGMCGGVFAALKTIDQLIVANPGKTIYVLHELVHNTTVTCELESRNVRFINAPEELPENSIALIGAHGVSAAVEAQLRSRAGHLADATCPLVKKLQNIAASLTDKEQLVIFGKPGHPEVVGTAGHSKAQATYIVSNEADIAALPELAAPVFVSQTTVDAKKSEKAMQLLIDRFPQIRCTPGVCDASKKRQSAVIELAKRCPVVIIAGSAHSSNACRLREIAENQGAKAFRVDNADELPEAELANCELVGLSSGASTPESVLEKIIARLQKIGFSA
jgi:4-hydroxy-3-methylbut-2-enyl diphosphate reductase